MKDARVEVPVKALAPKVLAFLDEHQPATSSKIRSGVGMTEMECNVTLQRMVDAGTLRKSLEASSWVYSQHDYVAPPAKPKRNKPAQVHEQKIIDAVAAAVKPAVSHINAKLQKAEVLTSASETLNRKANPIIVDDVIPWETITVQPNIGPAPRYTPSQSQIGDKTLLLDAEGRMTPIEALRDADRERNELIYQIANDAQVLSDQIKAFREAAFQLFNAFVERSSARYQARPKTKGNMRLTSFDGLVAVEHKIEQSITFDERLAAAKSLIDECLAEWSGNISVEIRTLIMDVFRVGTGGRLDAKRILSLQRYNFEDERWKSAMQAIHDAVTISHTRPYMRVYVRPDIASPFEAIPLNFSSL